jgi:TatD DNase family protein
MTFIDTHCHLHSAAYDADRDAVLARMKKRGVKAITVGTNAITSKQAINLAEHHADVYATVGYHPGNILSEYEDSNELKDKDPYRKLTMEKIANSSDRVVAIGEIGLDYSRLDQHQDPNFVKAEQKRCFLEQVSLAKKLDLPVVIHCRDAFNDLIDVLTAEKDSGYPVKGVIHCFTESWDVAEKLLDLGLYLSFTGIVTFKPRSKDDPEGHVHRVIERMPLERMMIETDAPWLSPDPYRGDRNEPIFVEYIAKKIAERRSKTLEHIANVTTRNAIEFFQLNT